MFNAIMDDRRARNLLANLYRWCDELTVSIISYESGKLVENFDIISTQLKDAITTFIDSRSTDSYMEIASASGYYDDDPDEPLDFTILYDVNLGLSIHELEVGALE